MSNGMSIARKSLPPESVTDTCEQRPSSLTCVSSFSPVQPGSIEELRTWLLRAFPASPSALPETSLPQKTSETCGPQLGTLFVTYSLGPWSLKTSPDLFPAATLEPSSVTWPKWGMWADGALLGLETPERPTSATDSGLWPTPNVPNGGRSLAHVTDWRSDRTAYHKGKKCQVTLNEAVRRSWPTPTAHNAKECAAPSEFNRNTPTLAAQASNGGPRTQGMSLNPAWVEWLMGWPIGWTDLKPLAMDKFRRWSAAHGRS